jgi:AhpD family alkylhydroperoxidase
LRYRELIGLTLAAHPKGPYCQAMHLAMAKGYGETEEELSEIAFTASFTSHWSAMIRVQNYDQDTFNEEATKVGEHLGKKERVVQTVL